MICLKNLPWLGVILATGQQIRFAFCVLATIIQALFLNGTSTNAEGCGVSFRECWGWGLTVQGYYGFIFAIVFILVIPVFWLKELQSTSELHTLSQFRADIWDTLQSRTTLYLLIEVMGIAGLASFNSNVNYYLQYYVIQLTNFETGIDGISTYLMLTVSIYIFKKYLINKNWRTTQYCSTIFAAMLSFLWIPAYFNIGGCRNAYYTIFVDLDQSFVSGISQVLFSMAVIELSKPGQEATTYELLITVNNAALTLGGVISTQLLYPLHATSCKEEPCPSNQVDVNNGNEGFESTDGPEKYTHYCLVLITIAVSSALIFVRFLPKDKEECHIWRDSGIQAGLSRNIGYISLFLSTFTVFYGFIVGILLLNSSTSCLEIVGGSGC